jgi:hypothetical protein
MYLNMFCGPPYRYEAAGQIDGRNHGNEPDCSAITRRAFCDLFESFGDPTRFLREGFELVVQSDRLPMTLERQRAVHL